MLIYAEFLANAGYGVFMIDLRPTEAATAIHPRLVCEADDVAGAVDYLPVCLDVNGQKIGALGISLGAQAALRGALKTDCLRALVLEGLGPVSLSDHGGRPKSLRRWINYPFNWIYYHSYEFMIGGHDTSVMEAIGKLAPATGPFNCQRRKGYLFQSAFFSGRE